MTAIAALPMYDWPEARASVDAEWAALRARLMIAGVDAPGRLVRHNADLPPVPGGIRDAEGRIIAPDPASLPPREIDLRTLWRHPDLLVGQTCWGPMEQGLANHVIVIGQPDYEGIEGGKGRFYSSAILMRRGNVGEGGARPSPDGRASLPLGLLRDMRLAYNGLDSMSGVIALTRDLEAEGGSLATFSELIETGSHRASIIAVAEGRADVCAVDCRSWQMARRYEARATGLRPVGWTSLRKGLPFITSRHTPADTVGKIVSALA